MKDFFQFKAELNEKKEIDEISMDRANAAYAKRKSQAQGAAAQGSVDYAKKQMSKASKTKDIMNKRRANDGDMSTQAGRKKEADAAAKHHQRMVKKWGADHPATKDAEYAAKYQAKRAKS